MHKSAYVGLALAFLVVSDAFSLGLSMALKGPVKLVYFNLRGKVPDQSCKVSVLPKFCSPPYSTLTHAAGRGELPRLILHAGGQKFDDCPGGIEKGDYEKDLLFGQVCKLKLKHL
jgi:hypothetical protein